MHPGLQARSIHREDGRLKEGGLIMRLKLVLLATMTLVVVASGSLELARIGSLHFILVGSPSD
jgi:hypothetical protein